MIADKSSSFRTATIPLRTVAVTKKPGERMPEGFHQKSAGGVRLPYLLLVLRPAVQSQSTVLRAILSGLGTLDHADTQAGIDNEDYGFYPRFYPEGDANDFVYGGSGKEVLFDLGGGDDNFFAMEGTAAESTNPAYSGLISGGIGADEMYGGDGNGRLV